MVINLEDIQYNTEHPTVWSKAKHGKAASEEYDLVNAISEHDTIEIVVPENTFSVSPQFLENMFQPCFDRLGEKGFKNKFKFTCKGDYNIDMIVGFAIHRMKFNRTLI